MEDFLDIGIASSKLFPNQQRKNIQYGTAGFRTIATDLPHVVFRMGHLAAIRSKAREGKFIGVMITASHNPEEDNGVKLCDPKGEMLDSAWEDFATQVANAGDDELPLVLQDIVNLNSINMNTPANLALGYDTRVSSCSLAQAFLQGASLLHANVKNFGLLTTPQLHYLVHCLNSSVESSYGEPTEEGYYKKLSTAFRKLAQQNPVKLNYTDSIKLDGANGVGALKAKALCQYLGNDLHVQLFNEGPPGKLNHLCGADYVKIQQEPPKGFPVEANARCVSFDGDGDRVVYFYLDGNSTFHLLDGDKISTLFTDFLLDMVKKTGLNLRVSVVQTAYANGSSTKYMSSVLNVPVVCVPTGVKHLHHKAQEADIGVYFEANGHGTVLFSKAAEEKIKDVARNTSETSEAAKSLLNVIDIINQTVGDAISDMLLVEIILRLRGWSVADWDALYSDFPNRQLKVKVSDRNVVTTTDAERRCVTPQNLQAEIDSLSAGKANGRAFVRPSGTEDIVRVYAEADTQSEADELAFQVSQKVYQLAGGVGPEPSRP